MKSRAHRYRYVRHVAMSCFPDGRASVAAPSISYSGTPFSWTYNVDIGTVSVTNTGGSVTSYAVNSGTLPTGVSLNTTTGDITGTPTVAKVAANVVIRATGPGGTADATISIAVPSPLYTSLVDYWNLDETSGTRVGSHAGLDLTDNNTVTSAAGVGGVGTAAQFTSANTEYLSRASQAALQTGDIDFTFIAWVRNDDASGFPGIVSKGRPGNAGHEYEAFLNAGSNKASFRVRKLDDSGFVTLDSNHVATLNTFVFLEFYHDKTNDVIGVNKNLGTEETAAIAGGVYGSGSRPFNIGALNGAFPFEGRIQAFGFWKRLLTANEKSWLYASGASARVYADFATYNGG